jgi:hypothetical protein
MGSHLTFGSSGAEAEPPERRWTKNSGAHRRPEKVERHANRAERPQQPEEVRRALRGQAARVSTLPAISEAGSAPGVGRASAKPWQEPTVRPSP